MRIMVTGHNGYIGSVMTPMLQGARHEVVGLDTCFYEDCTFSKNFAHVPTIRKDIRDIDSADLKNLDAIIHLAALCNDPLSDLNLEWTYEINHIASVRLARLAKKAGVKRFLYASSCSIYGAAGDAILSEDTSPCPLTPYACSKVRTEQDISRLADKDFSPVFMRNATAYGVSPKLRADLVLNSLVCWAYTTGKLRIMSNRNPWRPIVHVEDISNAFEAALTAPLEKIHNQAFNVGVNNENYQVNQLAEIVQETVPGCQIEPTGKGESDPRNYRVDFSKLAKTFPRLKIKWNARSGAKELYAAIQDARLTLDDFQGRKYIRLTQIKHLIKSGNLDETLRWNIKESQNE